MSHRFVVAIATILFSLASGSLHAQALVTLDENSGTLFKVPPYDAPGAVTYTADGILFDVGPELAGGVSKILLPGIDFAPNDYQWVFRFRLLPGNNIQGIGLTYGDLDEDEFSFNVETYLFFFDTSAYSPADGWVTLRQNFSAPFLVSSETEGIQNPDLVAIGIAPANGTGDRFHVEFDYVSIVPIPEPASISLLLVCAAACACLRFRKPN
jgi:hypothetical protein